MEVQSDNFQGSKYASAQGPFIYNVNSISLNC